MMNIEVLLLYSRRIYNQSNLGEMTFGAPVGVWLLPMHVTCRPVRTEATQTAAAVNVCY